jgi:hypothetical protein
VDIWDYFIQKERQFGEKSAWPDGEPELRADPDSDGREGFLRATLGMGLTAYVRVFEWITISDQGVPFREIYSYGLVIEEAFAYGWEHDPYTHPECPYHEHRFARGKRQPPEPADPISLPDALERAWELVTLQAEAAP